MNRVTIHRKDLPDVVVAVKRNSEFVHEHMRQKNVMLLFDGPEAIQLTYGDWIEVFGEKFTLNTIAPVIKKNSGLYQYSISFESKIYDLSKPVLLDTDGHSIQVTDGFQVSGNINVFVALLQANLDRVFPGEWEVRAYGIDADIQELIEFTEDNILQELLEICDVFGVEYEVSFEGGTNVLTLLGKSGRSLNLQFEYGRGKGAYELRRELSSSRNIVTRLYAFGSTRNIPEDYRNYSQRLKLPISIPSATGLHVTITNTFFPPNAADLYIQGTTNCLHVQGQLLNEDTGKWEDYGRILSAAEFESTYIMFKDFGVHKPPLAFARLKAWNYVGKYVFSDGTNSGFNVTVSNEHSYIQRDNVVSEFGLYEHKEYFEHIFPTRTGEVTAVDDESVVRFVDDTMFDLFEEDEEGQTKWVYAGLTPKIKFVTGGLAGYEFNIKAYYHNQNLFVIEKVQESGIELPHPEHVAYQISVGDKYKLIDIRMPQEYIDEAELRLYYEAEDWYARFANEPLQYSIDITPSFMKGRDFEIQAGDYVSLKDSALNIQEQLRVKEVRRNLLIPDEYSVVLAESVFRTKKKYLKETPFVGGGGMITEGNISDEAVTMPKIQDIPSMTVIGNVDVLMEEAEPHPVEIVTELDGTLTVHNSIPSALAVQNALAEGEFDKNHVYYINHKMVEVIEHGLGKKGSVDVSDLNGNKIICDVEWLNDDNSIKISFLDYKSAIVMIN